MKKIIPVVFVSTVFCINAFGAKPSKLNLKKQSKKNEKIEKIENVELIIMALKLPLENRIGALKNQGPKAVNGLQQISFDKKKSLQVRWRALTSLGIVAPHKSKSTLEKAMKSREWFMRNAAMVAAAHGDRQWALRWANKLMDDKALVVRTSAVNTIKKLKGKESQSLLWKKLYSKENFRKGGSLWIRKHIAETLSSFAHKGQEKQFIRMLRDRDKKLYPFALSGLEKITKGKFGYKKGMSVLEKRRQWLGWALRVNI